LSAASLNIWGLALPLIQAVQDNPAVLLHMFWDWVLMCLAADDVAKLLKEVGVSADQDNLKIMIEKCQGRPIHEIIAEGQKKQASMPSGGSGKYSLFVPLRRTSEHQAL